MKLRHLIILKVALLICLWLPAFFIWPKISLADTPSVAINEIAWMGTAASASDEWIELYNNTAQEIVLEGWKLIEGEGTVIIVLKGTLAPSAYYLIERTDDTTVSDIVADLKGSWGGSGLSNSGEKIQLLDNNSNLVDEINCSTGWFAGKASPDYKTMERINPSLSGNLAENWATNDGSALIGHDSQGNPIKGTPKAKNSVAGISLTTPSPSQSVSPAPTGTPSISPSPSTSPSATPTPYQYSQDIFINEFLPYPSKDELEWVELFNGGSQTINLTGWGLSDSATSHQPFQIAIDTKIEPGAYLIVSLSKSFLNNDGDQVKLLWPDGQVVHSVSYQKAKQNYACAKLNGQWLWTNQPTPGEENKNSYFASATPAPEGTTPNVALIQTKEEVAADFIAPKTNQATELTPSPPNILGAAAKEITTANSQNEPPLAAASQPAPNSKTKTALELLGVVVVAILASLAIISWRQKTKNDS